MQSKDVVLNADNLTVLMARLTGGDYLLQPIAIRKQDDGSAVAAVGKVMTATRAEAINEKLVVLAATSDPQEIMLIKIDGSDECGVVISNRELGAGLLMTTADADPIRKFFSEILDRENDDGSTIRNIFNETDGLHNPVWLEDPADYPHLSFDVEILKAAADGEHLVVDGTVDEAISAAKLYGYTTDNEVVN